MMRVHWRMKDPIPSRVPVTVRKRVLERANLSMPYIRGQTVCVVMKSRHPRHQMTSVMWNAMVIPQTNVCSLIPGNLFVCSITNSA